MTQLTEAYDHIDEIKSLFSEYTAMLVLIDPSFSLYLDIQHYDDEAQDPAVKYAPPKGRLYLALHDGKAAGCIALRPLSDDRKKLAKLYETRLPVYRQSCDIEIDADADIAAITELILKEYGFES